MTGPQVPSETTTAVTETENPTPEAPPIPPTPVPTGPSIEDVTRVYNDALREASIRAQRAEQQLENERATRTPQSTPEQDKEAFFENPRQMIREEMKQMIEPLNETSRMFQRNNIISNFIERAKVLPAFKFLSNASIYNGFLQSVSSLAQINDDILTATYNMVVGHALNTGLLTFEAPTPVTQPTSNQPIVPNSPPPNAPPTPPLRPVDPTRKRRALNEHEKMLAKYNNMSEDAYLDFLEMDKSAVATSEVK